MWSRTRAAATIRPIARGQRLTLGSFEHCFEQRIAAFADGTNTVMGFVEHFVNVGQVAAGGFLECDGDGFAFAAMIAAPMRWRRSLAHHAVTISVG